MSKTNFIILIASCIISLFLAFKFRALAIKADENYKETLAGTLFGLSFLFFIAFCVSLLILLSPVL